MELKNGMTGVDCISIGGEPAYSIIIENHLSRFVEGLWWSQILKITLSLCGIKCGAVQLTMAERASNPSH